MPVFPEAMDRLDLNNTADSLRKVENYIHYMTERMEFANSNTTKTVSEAGVSNVEIYKMILTMGDTISLVNASLTNLTNRVNTINTTLTELGETVEGLAGDVKTMQGQIADLTGRVETLEGGE